MAAKTTKKTAYTGPRSFDGQFTRAMPEDVEHYTLTMEEIRELPIVVWNESNNQWEFDGDE